MRRIFYICVAILLCNSAVLANSPTYSGPLQRNDNVKILYLYSYGDSDLMQVQLSNGQFCYINSDESNLQATVLEARSQNATVEVLCNNNADKSIDGRESRHLQRIRY